MDFLKKLYRNGGDACELLRLVREKFQLDNGLNIIGYVEQLRRQKNELAQLYGITAKHNTDADKLHYETEITQHDEAIARAEKLALNNLKRKLIDGVFYGLGYPSPDANLRLIPLKEWVFLELDIQQSRAQCEGKTYAGIRFISCDFYKQELDKLSYEELLGHRDETRRQPPTPANLKTEKPWLKPDDRDKPQPEEQESELPTLDRKYHRLIKQWLYDFWIENNRPETKRFFRLLKQKKGDKGSPIKDHWGAGSKDGGFHWKIGDSEDDMSYKRLGNMVSEDFKKTRQPPRIK